MAAIFAFFSFAALLYAGDTASRCTGSAGFGIVVIAVTLLFLISSFIPQIARTIYRNASFRLVMLVAAIVVAIPFVPCTAMLVGNLAASRC